MITRLTRLLFVASLLVPASTSGASLTASFDDGQVPGRCAVYGSAKVENTGGLTNSGVLKLTKAVNDQTGSFVIADLDNGASVYGFRVSLQARVGGGTTPPADGWSFNFSRDLPNSPFGEEGAGTGITVEFDTFDNGGAEAPSIKIKVAGRIVAFRRLAPPDLITGAAFVPVRIDLEPDGNLSVSYGGTFLFAQVSYPPALGVRGARFGLGARTGGSNANHFIDDLAIETILTPPATDSAPPTATPTQVSLGPFSCCDGQVDLASLNGQSVWQLRPGNDYMYFHLPPTFRWLADTPVYVQVTYADVGHGTVGIQYDSSRGNDLSDFYWRSETHTRSSRVGTGQFVRSYHRLSFPKLAGRENGGTDFRLFMDGGGEVPLSVQSVLVQTTPFDDPTFQYALTQPWLAPYSGPTTPYVEPVSLRHKVMVGYQGWFRAPNDLSDVGWRHWCRDNQMIPQNFSVDLWPDLTGFGSNELFRAGNVLTSSGQPAYLFSSTTRETVRRHFRWMRQSNIDGAFLQRFVHPNSSGAWGNDEWVLHHVREAANEEGRIWAIEYDVSSLNPTSPGNAGLDPLAVIQTDWKWLVDVVGVLHDPQYAHEQGKPVVFIWGLPFPDRGFTRAVADKIVTFLRDDPQYGGNYVIGGVPSWWRSMPDWFDHIRLYNGALAWMPQSASEFAADYQLLHAWGIDYFPHAWPGFSWANLQREPASSSFLAPRAGGAFFWDHINQALNSGAERLFIGMFDEYDEGTAIMPMSDDPPQPPPEWGRFITNEGRPSDWWMVLAGAAKDMLLNYRPRSGPLPTDLELAPRAQVGPEAYVDLGAINQESLLHPLDLLGARTTPIVIAGKDCRSVLPGGADQSFAFNVDPAFAYAVAIGLSVTLDVEYLDFDNQTQFTLLYDSTGDANRPHPKVITTQGTGEWRVVRYNIADAFFGDRQDGGADFRLKVSGNGTPFVNRVWLAKSWDVLPQIVTQPIDQALTEGDPTTLTFLAQSAQPVTYQWWFDDAPLAQATATNLTLSAVTLDQAGSYYALALTPTGWVTSRVAQVTVQALPKLTWTSPSAIVYGTALSSEQLNASASVPGTFTYYPPTGVVLPAGAAQVLTARFQPAATGSQSLTQSVVVTVLPAPLIVSAENSSRPFGMPNPPLTVSYVGWVNGDTATSLTSMPMAHTVAGLDSVPGVYPILVDGASAPNYTFQFVPGTLTVTRAPQTIRFDPIPAKALGTQPFTLTASASSGLPVIYLVESGPVALVASTVALQGLGEVVIRASQPGDDRYEAAVDVEQSFSVVPPIRSPHLLATGEFVLTFTGEPGRSYSLEASYDLLDWVPLTTMLNVGGTLEFSDASIRTFQWRFYRVVAAAAGE